MVVDGGSWLLPRFWPVEGWPALLTRFVTDEVGPRLLVRRGTDPCSGIELGWLRGDDCRLGRPGGSVGLLVRRVARGRERSAAAAADSTRGVKGGNTAAVPLGRAGRP